MNTIEPTFDKKFDCPICKKSFMSKRIRSRFVKIAKFDTDFLPIYESNEANPIYYHIQVCPSCGFSFSEEFAKFFPPGSLEAIQKEVTQKWVPHNFGALRTWKDAIQTYKLAVFCGLLKKEKHIVLAGLYLRIAWLYRENEDELQEQRFINLALKEYEDSYVTDDFRGTQVSEIKLLYLIGELSRRLNDLPKAIQYFSRVIEKQKQSIEPRIIEMAKERWHEIKDKRELHA